MELGHRSHLDVSNGHLTIGGADTVEISNTYGTPLYVIDELRIREKFREFQDAFPDADIYYATKANGNLAVLRVLADERSGADVFSGGELYMALIAGISNGKILFNGNSKSDDEIRMAIESDVDITVDSLDELRTIYEISSDLDKVAKIAFRVNPDVSPSTHPKIATGLRTSKFGIPWDEAEDVYREAMKLENVEIRGIHCHIGSQILELSVYQEATRRMMELAGKLVEADINLEFIDLGGGLGIPYRADDPKRAPKDLAEYILPVFTEKCKEFGIEPRLILEPGRYIIADSTILLSRVNAMKRAYKNFVAIDAGMNLINRPMMYDGYHEIAVANKMGHENAETYTIAGPICETGDVLAENRDLPRVEKGDLIAILDAGAYCFSMSSQYNGRPRCAEILVNDGKAEIIREREIFGDLIRNQIIPSRLL